MGPVQDLLSFAVVLCPTFTIFDFQLARRLKSTQKKSQGFVPPKKMRISFNASSKGTMLFSKTSKKKICVFDVWLFLPISGRNIQISTCIYRMWTPLRRIANEGFGWNPRTYTVTVTCHLGWSLSPLGGSAWVTLAVALDDPRVSTWRLEVGSFFFFENHFNWLTASGLAILINNDTRGGCFSHPWYGRWKPGDLPFS